MGEFVLGLLVIAIAGVMLFRVGSCIEAEEERKDAKALEEQRQKATVQLECIRVGKQIIGDSCVKVAP